MLPRRMEDWCARSRQQLERRERFQIQSAGYRESGPRLICAQRKFHGRSIDSIDLLVVETAAGQRYLAGEHHIALHIGRGSLEGSAGK